MKDHYEIAVIGAGPAGMAAAAAAAGNGAATLLVDEQESPGGQIYRAIEEPCLADRNILGADYYKGQGLAQALRKSRADYLAGATVWRVSRGREIGLTKDGVARTLSADQIILASGAQERPFPVPGWTLPGVMSAGAAQILLKASALAAADAIFAGTGPLLYLIVHQYIKAGIPVKAVLDTTPRGNYLRAIPYLPAAMAGIGKLLKGRRWITEIKRAGVPLIEGVTGLRALGDAAATGIEYEHGGAWRRIDAEHVFLHQGIVPNVNLAMAAGCAHVWHGDQLCWRIVADAWGATDIAGVAAAGDGAGIGGAVAAEHQGRIAALGALHRMGKLDEAERDRMAAPSRSALKAEMRLRPFLDALFKPLPRFRVPPDAATTVCRCEDVTAGQLRDAVAVGCIGPNQLKSFSRCGMGPCQGRLCGLTVGELIAQQLGRPVSDVGYFRLRSPVKPLLLEELANLELPTVSG